MKTDFVIDCETLGTDSDCVVLSLAVTPFERNDLKTFQEYVEDTWYWKFDVEPQVLAGRTMSSETLDWWSKQDESVRESQMNPSEDDVSLPSMIKDLYKKFKEKGINSYSKGWARGKEFDFGILDHIIKTHKGQVDPEECPINDFFFPVPFWNKKDIRDYISGLMVDPDVTKVPLPKGSLEGFKHHDPIHDCARAVLHIKYAEMYAKGELEVPEDPDPCSNK